MKEIIKYYNDTLEKDETKIYNLKKKKYKKNIIILYYKTKK